MNSRTATWAAVGAWVAVRLLLTGWHSMALWGLNAQRFLAPPIAWLTGIALIAPLVPILGPRIAALCDAAGDRLAVSRSSRVIAAALFAILVFVLEDRTRFTGDALIRNAASDAPGLVARFTQALPLELLLYERVPLALASAGLPATLPARLLGAIAAFGLALAALALGREFARRGAWVVAIACVIGCGGWLVTFTGLGKPAALLCALTAISAAAAVRVARSGPGLATLGVMVAFAILLHRAGVFLVPCWLLALGFAVRDRAMTRSASRTLQWALTALPVVALAVITPRVLRIATSIDLPYHLLAARSVPVAWRALDMFNLSLLMCPAAIPILAGFLRKPASPSRRTMIVALSLLAPWLVLACVAQPGQGIFRDVDFFAPGGVALAICLAGLLGEPAGADPGLASSATPAPLAPHASSLPTPRLAAALAALCAIPALQLLLCWHEPNVGMARVSAYLSESPGRTAAEREQGWDFLALRALGTGDWKTAALACDAASRLAPNPRMLIMLGIARTYLGEFEGARQAYSRVLERSPRESIAWAGLAGIATRLGDRALADSAMARVRAIPASSLKARELNALIAQYPEFWPGR